VHAQTGRHGAEEGDEVGSMEALLGESDRMRHVS